MDFVEKVLKFNEIAGNDGFDARRFSMYVGLITEEFSELLQSYNNTDWNDTINYLNDLSHRFKRGDYDDYTESESFDKVSALDACVDIAVVSLGAGKALGADVNGACHAVADNNLSKFNYNQETGEYTVLKDANGKVKKPENFVPVKLDSYV